MKIIAIGGEPATGKTTLMRGVLEIMGPKNFVPWQYKLVRGHLSMVNRLLILGLYDDAQTFAGTDRLSMGVMPDAVGMLAEFGELFPGRADQMTILFEGDRLFNAKFLAACGTIAETMPIVLTTSAEAKKERHEKRGDNQTEKWLKSRETKLRNIQKEIRCVEWRSETDRDQRENLINLLKIL